MSDETNPNLKHNKVINEQRLFYGVPRSTFVCACIFVVAFGAMNFLVGFVVFMLVIPPLIVIHKDDEKALSFLFDKLRRPNRYFAGGVDEKDQKVIRKRGSKYLVIPINQVK